MLIRYFMLNVKISIMAFSIRTLKITPFSIKIIMINVTPSIMTLDPECRYH
jgi:hypothetical protein